MARPMHLLTPASIMNLPPGRHADGGGLYLQVLPGGTRSWLFRYDLQRKCHWLGIGRCDAGALANSLQEARKQAADAREHLRQGKDPLAVKRERTALLTRARVVTFKECSEAYLTAHESTWRSPIHVRQWRQCLDSYILPKLGRLPVADIGPGNVECVLSPLWRSKPEVARKVCGKIGMVVNLAIAKGYRSAANPASLKIMRTILGPLQQKPKHHPAMPWRDVPAFMRKIEHRRDVPALALMLLILTGLRSKEARGACWSEFDLAGATWRVPANRMKGNVDHDVPLSLAAVAVLEAVPRLANCDFVFPGQKPGKWVSETSLRNILREHGYTKDAASIHGFRSSFKDWCAENSVDEPVSEACLAHQVPDPVVRAYRRTKFLAKRKDAMERWGLFLS